MERGACFVGEDVAQGDVAAAFGLVLEAVAFAEVLDGDYRGRGDSS